jgi:hypothetical protein
LRSYKGLNRHGGVIRITWSTCRGAKGAIGSLMLSNIVDDTRKRGMIRLASCYERKNTENIIVNKSG